MVESIPSKDLSFEGKYLPISPNDADPNIESIIEWISTSPSEWPSSV